MRLGRVQLALAAAILASCQLSIFAAELLLAVVAVVFAARLAAGHTSFPRLPLDGPILAFAVWTLLSASFSPQPLVSYESAKKLVLFLLLYVMVDTASARERRERLVDAALLGGVALGAGALAQFYLLGFDTVNHRPTSFLGHYMTASGLSMSVLVLAAARLVLAPGVWALPSRHDLGRLALVASGVALLTTLQALGLFAVEADRLFVAGLGLAAMHLVTTDGPWRGPATGSTLAAAALLVSSWSLVISRTRNAWLGALLGLAVVAVLRAPRTLWVLAAFLAALAVVRPQTVVDRLTVTDASSVDRYYMWQAGIDMIRDKPVFGQGPGTILSRYPLYRWPQAPNTQAPHLHDNALQIAAERGLPCLGFWIWWVASALADAWREWRRPGSRGAWTAAATLAVLSAVMVAGLFEYNFGDSEVLLFVLSMTALPYGARRESQSTIAPA
jgi:O-antigen ligase